MVQKASFLNAPYAAYYHREVPNEDEELTHVGPGTPFGEYMRRFWQPVACSHELKELPKAIRIMGEDLVVFRDKSGRVGLLELHCPHRGTSLEFGLIQERGIRCCYHFWDIDIDGRILAMPGEPPESTLKERLCHGAYPVLEWEGLIFAYMGPPDKRPELPVYDIFNVPGWTRTKPHWHEWPCNWLQVKENCMDPYHTEALHTLASPAQQPGSETLAAHGVMDWYQTPNGMVYSNTRRVGDNIWVRMVDYISPGIHNVPRGEAAKKESGFSSTPLVTDWLVPVDDTHTALFTIQHIPGSERRDFAPFFGQSADRPYEERQRVPGDYDAQVTQRPIARHALEHLGATDRGVIMFRKLLREQIRAVQGGEDPKGLVREAGRVLPSYWGSTVVRVPPARTPDEDRRLLGETGRRIAEEHIRERSTVSAGTNH